MDKRKELEPDELENQRMPTVEIGAPGTGRKNSASARPHLDEACSVRRRRRPATTKQKSYGRKKVSTISRRRHRSSNVEAVKDVDVEGIAGTEKMASTADDEASTSGAIDRRKKRGSELSTRPARTKRPNRQLRVKRSTATGEIHPATTLRRRRRRKKKSDDEIIHASRQRTAVKRRKVQRRKPTKAVQENAGQCQRCRRKKKKKPGAIKKASLHVHFPDQTKMPIKRRGMVKKRINKGRLELKAGKNQKGSAQFVGVKGQPQAWMSGLMANNHNVTVKLIVLKRKGSGKKKTNQAGLVKLTN